MTITFAKRDSVSGWARRTGIPRHVINERINSMGWIVKRALTETAMRKGQRIVFNHSRRIITRIAASFVHHASETGR